MRGIIFGPVKSRRLGNSLGIDLTPYKTCNLDCIYCECGKTTCLTNARKEYYQVDEIISYIKEAVETRGPIDYITFSGSGEPTLYLEIKALVKEIKENFPKIKLAVLTNSTLLTDKDVFEALLLADVVLPSVDSVLNNGFKKINRPHSDLDLKKVLAALKKFKKSFKGLIWVEVFVCPGINDTKEELTALAKYLKELSPDRVQINTLDRPGTETWLKALDEEGLKKVLEYFIGLPVEVISRTLSFLTVKTTTKSFDSVLDTMKKRPLTFNDIVQMSSYSEDEVKKWIKDELRKKTMSKTTNSNGVEFFKSK
ncbi:MAG: radical SAM protein [bacterium]